MLNRGLDKLELLRIIDAVANEKSIDKDIVIGSMESAIQKAALTKFGQNNNIFVIYWIKNIWMDWSSKIFHFGTSFVSIIALDS